MWVNLQNPDCDLVGTPIEVEKRENPTMEEIDSVHEKFVDELVRLFERYKNEFLENPQPLLLE